MCRPNPVARFNVFDALEDKSGRIWLATPGGLAVLDGKQFRIVAPGGPILTSSPATLNEGPDGTIWAGTFREGTVARAGRRAPPLHRRRRPFERSDPHAALRPRWVALDRNVRRRSQPVPRRPLHPLHRTRRPAQRQHRQDFVRRRIAVAQHDARHLPHRAAAAPRVQRGPPQDAGAGQLRCGRRTPQRAMRPPVIRWAAAAHVQRMAACGSHHQPWARRL